MSLGKSSETLLKESNAEIQEERQSLHEAEKQLSEAQRTNKQKEKIVKEMKDLKTRLEKTQAKMDQLESNVENESELRELEQRAKNYRADLENTKKEGAALEKKAKQKESAMRKEKAKIAQTQASLANKESERNALKARLNNTKTLDEMKEQEAELQCQNKEDEAVIENADTLPSEKQAASLRVMARTEELARLQTQIAERENALPLRERVKEIFKKYGVTVTVIFLAAGATIGAVVGDYQCSGNLGQWAGERAKNDRPKSSFNSAWHAWLDSFFPFQNHRPGCRLFG